MNAAILASAGRPVEPRPVRPRLLYPALVIAAISVTLFSLIGIAAMTGLLPSAHSTTPETVAAKPVPTGKSTTPSSIAGTSTPGTSTPASSTAASTQKTRIAAATCGDCGTIASISTVERQADTTGIGAVAGGLTGALLGNQVGHGSGRAVMTIAGGAGGAYLGNKIEGNTRRSTAYKIVVRMENGSERTIHQTEAPSFPVGSQVKVIGNSVVART